MEEQALFVWVFFQEMFQEIGAWLKVPLAWNVFIFLDLADGTFEGGK